MHCIVLYGIAAFFSHIDAHTRVLICMSCVNGMCHKYYISSHKSVLDLPNQHTRHTHTSTTMYECKPGEVRFGIRRRSRKSNDTADINSNISARKSACAIANTSASHTRFLTINNVKCLCVHIKYMTHSDVKSKQILYYTSYKTKDKKTIKYIQIEKLALAKKPIQRDMAYAYASKFVTSFKVCD